MGIAHGACILSRWPALGRGLHRLFTHALAIVIVANRCNDGIGVSVDPGSLHIVVDDPNHQFVEILYVVARNRWLFVGEADSRVVG